MSLAARFGCFGEEKEENGEKYFIYQKVSCAPTGKDVHVVTYSDAKCTTLATGDKASSTVYTATGKTETKEKDGKAVTETFATESVVSNCFEGTATKSTKSTAKPTAVPTEDEIVVITQTLSITGVTAAEVCTSSGKQLIEAVIAELLDVDTNNVQVSKCIDTTSRRSRRLLASGIDLEYQVSLPATEATAKKQSEVVDKMATLEGESAATTSVVAAVAKAAGKDIGAVTVKGSKPIVTVETKDESDLSMLNAATTLQGVSWSVVATLVGLIALM